MKQPPHAGLTGEHTFAVEQKHAIEFADDAMPAVLATPILIGLMERTARQTLAPLLEDNERSVGIEIDLKHLAPSPIGAKVTVTARVIRAEGREITFQVEARDEHEVISRGLHKRAIIRVEGFRKRVAAKAGMR